MYVNIYYSISKFSLVAYEINDQSTDELNKIIGKDKNLSIFLMDFLQKNPHLLNKILHLLTQSKNGVDLKEVIENMMKGKPMSQENLNKLGKILLSDPEIKKFILETVKHTNK